MVTMKNKTALVIGGTSGIGKATVNMLLERGAVVHVVGRSIHKISDQQNLIKHKAGISKFEDVEVLIAEKKI
jgi:NAD(P)-dependent dehydrogenase (short-subunit alcohol dehydrogenase family)